MNLRQEINYELNNHIIPFWKNLRDVENGGFYGRANYDLNIIKESDKGCILNSRILWFFSMAYATTGQTELLDYASHSYNFMNRAFVDKENYGLYWSVSYDGKCLDDTKHTYCQAFAIYALSAYYRVSGDKSALEAAMVLFNLIESKCSDALGYGEAFDKNWNIIVNDKLSENGVIADKTMNTLLHIYEAYTGLYAVTKSPIVKDKMLKILDIFTSNVYNPELHRLEVFFDKEYRSIINLYSYGHDIEASWLIDYGLDILDDADIKSKYTWLADVLVTQTFNSGFTGNSMLLENENGMDDTSRVWWVQCEAIIGFVNAFHKNPKNRHYLDAAEKIWGYVKNYIIDSRPGGEWFWEVNENGHPESKRDICDPWKCPYHNGRMCFEILRRI